MPDLHAALHRADASRESRFQRWLDRLVDPVAGPPPVPDRDIADLAATARDAVHTAGIGSATSLAPDRIDAMWEQIMSTTAISRPVAPSATGARVAAPRGSVRFVPPLPAAGWLSYLATAALIAVLVLVSVTTVWRVAGPFGGNDPDTARQPGIAGSATPGESPDGCPLASDMPLFMHQAPSFTLAGGAGITHALVQPDGDLVILCDGVDDPEPLVTGVTGARQLGWPGTVLLEIEGDAAVAFNVATGDNIELGDYDVVAGDGGPGASGVRNDPHSPWLQTPNNAAWTDWRLTNLETRQSLVLSDEIGGVLPRAYLPTVIWHPSSPVAVMTRDRDGHLPVLPPNAADAVIAERPGDALVVDDTFETARWIDTRGEVAVSADGAAIAYVPRDTTGPLRVEEARSGDELAEYPDFAVNNLNPSRFAFAGDDASLVFLVGNDVWLATYGDEPTTTLLETGDMRPDEVHATGVPGRVLVMRITDDSFGASGYAFSPRAVSIVDTVSGDVSDIDGFHAPVAYLAENPRQLVSYIVTTTPSGPSDEMTIYHLVDLASGDVVLSSEPVDVSIGALANDFILPFTSIDGAVAVMPASDGRSSLLFDAVAGTVASITVEGVDVPEDRAWLVLPSSDGGLLLALGFAARSDPGSDSDLEIRPPAEPDAFAVARISTDPEWMVADGTAPEHFILGIPSQPLDDEPVVLDAPDIPTLNASPAATPATDASPVAVDTPCDLTGDIPVVTSADTLPWDGTVLVLADDTLTAHCDGGAEIIAEGVADVRGTGWPGAIIVTTTDGTLRGINLITGATGDLGPETLLTEALTDWSSEPLLFRAGSPWLFLPANIDLTDWRIVDLRSMDSMLLSDDLDGVLPAPITPDQLAFSGGTAMIAFAAYPNPADADNAPLANDVLIIDGSLDNRRWTQFSATDQLFSMSLSPDGELFAMARETDDGLAIDVRRTDDNASVAEPVIDLARADDVLVLDDGAGLLHLSRFRLDLATWDGEPETTTLLEIVVDEGQPYLHATADPDVVVVELRYPDGPAGGYLVDVVTGQTTALPGLVSWPLSPDYASGAPARSVVGIVPFDGDEGAATIQLIDVSTGEIMVESDPIAFDPDPQRRGGPSFVTADGRIAFVHIDPDRMLVLDATAGTSFVMNAPDNDRVDLWLMAPSMDGTLLSTFPPALEQDEDVRGYLTEVGPDAEWVELPPGSLIGIVPGADADIDP